MEYLKNYLQQMYAHYFLSKTRQRGLGVFRKNAVSVTEIGKDMVSAEVQGSRFDPYKVEIYFDEDHTDIYENEMYCTCPYSQEWGNPCKHIWALILYLDSKNLTAILFPHLGINPQRVSQDFQKFLPTPTAVWNNKLEQLSSAGIEPQQSIPLYEFTIDLNRSKIANKLAVDINIFYQKKNGQKGRQLQFRKEASNLLKYGSVFERKLFGLLHSLWQSSEASDGYYYSWRYSSYSSDSTAFVNISLIDVVLDYLAKTDLVWVKYASNEPKKKLILDKARSWKFEIELIRKEDGYILNPLFKRDNETIPFAKTTICFNSDPKIFFKNEACFIYTLDIPFKWIPWLREYLNNPFVVPSEDLTAFFEKTIGINRGNIPFKLPIDFWQETYANIKPQSILQVDLSGGKVICNLQFNYQIADKEYRVSAFPQKSGIQNYEEKTFIQRSLEEEKITITTLDGLLDRDSANYAQEWGVSSNKIFDVLDQIMEQEIRVEAKDKRQIKKSSAINIRVSSGIDWFSIDGVVKFDDLDLSVLDLLESLRKGERFVQLSNNKMGMIPEKWFESNKWLLKTGTIDKKTDTLKLSKYEMALLGTSDIADEITFDKESSAYLSKLKKFSEIISIDTPDNFKGSLRDYQKGGLAWLNFLHEFSFGGILADDMGLGKTIQVIALLQNIVQKIKKPILIVMPTSLIFNWELELNRFAPDFPVIRYTGTGRKIFKTKPLIYLTTYGVLRRDIGILKDINFFYVILDEAQAIKNPQSSTAKAARHMNADFKLALTGTPIENNLTDLWSIMTFLNPGLLGSKDSFEKQYSNKRSKEEDLHHLQRLIKPFFLRRTKEGVLKELPSKTEQVVYCEMDKKQSALHNDIRNVYRAKLLDLIETDELKKNSFCVLEGLLRLRQVACHPKLINQQSSVGSVKMETCLKMITEIVNEGNKVLFFSQFTTLLQLFEQKIKQENINYTYLDGKTRNRQKVIDKFNNSDKYKLFLISLKAGGLGLNLTSANYVFIYDPWWNPAVENQAIDRTHRIGQKNKVFVYRIICRDSIEEKVLELQNKKNKLAKQLISSEKGLLKQLSKKDVEYLFS